MAAKPKPLKPAIAKLAVSTVAAVPSVKTSRATPAKMAGANVAALMPVPILASMKMAQPAIAVANQKPASPTTVLKKKDLIDKVVATTGAKQAVVRDIIEATLTVLGDALSKGTMLNLPPFGKAKVSRPSDAASGKAMTVKLRRSQSGAQAGAKGASAKAKQSLAEDED